LSVKILGSKNLKTNQKIDFSIVSLRIKWDVVEDGKLNFYNEEMERTFF